MKNRIVLGILICAVLISMCGCTWSKSFSEEDTKAIASYSAKLVAKYNTRQQDGIVEIDESDEDSVASDSLKELSKLVDSTSNNTTTNNTSSNNSSSSDKTPVSLASALGVSGADFTYLGYEVRDSYTTSVYDMSANSGYRFLVMKFNLTNTSITDAEVNIISKNPKFTAVVNGSSTASNDLSLMPEDLATFKGTIRAGESRELIILFQFKSEDLANIQSTSLQCTVSGSTQDITL